MSGNARPRALLMDWGGVLTAALPTAFGQWLVRDDVEPAHFDAVMRGWLQPPAARPGTTAPGQADDPVHALERGQLTPADFERVLARRLAGLGSPVTADGLLHRMLAGLAALQPDMIELVREVRARGVRTAVLSNSWGEHYPDDVLDREFDAVVVSGRVGLRKPDPEIYLLTAERVGAAAADCVFVDDAEVNVVAARALGMTGVRHVDATTTRTAVVGTLSLRKA